MKAIMMTAIGALMLLATSAQAQQPITADGTYLYSGPGDDYPPVVQLGAAYPLQIYGCVGGYTWCDVSYEDYRGWIDGRDIEYPYQNDEVPVDLYGPQLGLPIVSFVIGAYWGAHYHDRPFYSERPHWENHAPPPRYWGRAPDNWDQQHRDRYQHFAEVRRTGGFDPHGNDHGDHGHDNHDQQQRDHDQQQRQHDQQQRDQQQRQQQDQQRRQQDQQHQQQAQQQRQQQDQQRRQQQQDQQQRAQQQRQQQDQQRQQQRQQQAQQQQQQRQQQAQQQQQQRQQQAQQQQQQRQQQAQQHQQQAQQQHAQQPQQHHGDDHEHH